MIPSGAWLEFEIEWIKPKAKTEKADAIPGHYQVAVRIDRKRKQSAPCCCWASA